MTNKPVVLIVLNILLDVLQKREPFYETSTSLLAAVEEGQVRAYVAADNLATLFYPIQNEKSSAEEHTTITKLFQFIKVAPVDQSAIEQALNLDTRDFEDAVQMITTMQCKAVCPVTRNVKDYRPALLPVMQPVDFLSTL